MVGQQQYLDLLVQLKNVVVTIREEQVSSKIGFGRTLAEKKERANIYAAEIQRQANKIDAILDQLIPDKEEQK